MSAWMVLCLKCDWSTVVDDLDSGAALGSAHEDVCEPVQPQPWPDGPGAL